MNSLRVHISCSFKGDDHELDTVIDLDALDPASGEAPDFHRLLAQSAGIDTYSYLYEVVESSDIVFSEATGLATLCGNEESFDWQRFRQLCREDEELRILAPIAANCLGVEDLDQRLELKTALLEAYRAGKAAGAR